MQDDTSIVDITAGYVSYSQWSRFLIL